MSNKFNVVCPGEKLLTSIHVNSEPLKYVTVVYGDDTGMRLTIDVCTSIFEKLESLVYLMVVYEDDTGTQLTIDACNPIFVKSELMKYLIVAYGDDAGILVKLEPLKYFMDVCDTGVET